MMIPHEVVSRIVDGALPAFAQQETVAKPRKATREKIAAAFGITASQLEL